MQRISAEVPTVWQIQFMPLRAFGTLLRPRLPSCLLWLVGRSVLHPKRNDPKCKVRKRLGRCPLKRLQYSYKRSTGTPIGTQNMKWNSAACFLRELCRVND